MEFQENQYKMDQAKKKWSNRVTYYLTLVLRGFFYIAKIIGKVILETVKGVLKTFGVPIGKV